MDTHDIEDLAIKLAVFTRMLEQRAADVEQQVTQASEGLQNTARDVASSAQRLTGLAVGEFRRTSKQVLAAGMQPALDQATSDLRERMHEITAATRQLEHRVLALNALHTATAWKAFVASAVASLAIIGVAVFMGIQAHRQVQRAHWDSAVNTAIASGELRVCADGGVCVRIGKKWVRLEQ